MLLFYDTHAVQKTPEISENRRVERHLFHKAPVSLIRESIACS